MNGEIEKTSPGGVSLLGGFQTKNPEEEQPPWRTTPKINRFWVFEGEFLFLQVLDLGPPQQRNPPRGEFHTIKLGGDRRVWLEVLVRQKYTYSVISVKLDSLPGNTKKHGIDLFVAFGARLVHFWADPTHSFRPILTRPSLGQGWNNRTLISHELLVCSKKCFSKTEPVQ